MTRTLTLLSLLGVLSWGGGCTTEWVRQDASTRSPQSVAVLPFVAAGDLKEEPQTGHYANLMGSIVAGRLAKGPFLLLPPRQVLRRLEQGGVATPTLAEEVSAERLRELLGVDLVIRGALIENLHVQAGLVYWRSVGCRIEATDLRDGARFALVESLEVDFGGLLMEMGQPVEGIEDSIDSHTELAFVRLAEFLADSLLSYLPAPERPPRVAGPTITEVSVSVEKASIASKALVGPRSRITASLRGDPGQSASLRLGLGRAIPLEESAPGLYEGTYRVTRGDRCESLSVLLTDEFGAGSLRELGLSFDLRPPGSPRELGVDLVGERVRVRWSPPLDRPPAQKVSRGRYAVYALSADQRLVERARVARPEVLLSPEPGVVAYLVSAVSEAGVLGPPARVAAPAGEVGP